jgi:hypothetical protein
MRSSFGEVQSTRFSFFHEAQEILGDGLVVSEKAADMAQRRVESLILVPIQGDSNLPAFLYGITSPKYIVQRRCLNGSVSTLGRSAERD